MLAFNVKTIGNILEDYYLVILKRSSNKIRNFLAGVLNLIQLKNKHEIETLCCAWHDFQE